MRYRNVEDWANSRDAVVYDFVEDTQENLDITNDYRDLESYEKYCVYKYMCGKGRDKTVPAYIEKSWSRIEERLPELKKSLDFEQKAKKYQIGDPDSRSVLLQEIYKLLWKDLKATASDTMTSATRRFNDAMNISKMKEIIYSKETVKGKINEIRKAHGGIKQRWSEQLSIIVEAVLDDKKEFYRIIDKQYPAMRNFFDLWHTIGNYCPVPEEFNGARSGSCADHDYWDLTLMKIREWYRAVDNERNQLLSRDLLHDKGNVENCVQWLEYFGQGEEGWHNFVDTLLMQDYVYNENDGINQDNEKYYDVKPFWSKHGWEKNKGEKIGLPEDIEDINQGLEEICFRIAARSIRIVNACRHRIQSQKAEKK